MAYLIHLIFLVIFRLKNALVEIKFQKKLFFFSLTIPSGFICYVYCLFYMFKWDEFKCQ